MIKKWNSRIRVRILKPIIPPLIRNRRTQRINDWFFIFLFLFPTFEAVVCRRIRFYRNYTEKPWVHLFQWTNKPPGFFSTFFFTADFCFDLSEELLVVIIPEFKFAELAALKTFCLRFASLDCQSLMWVRRSFIHARFSVGVAQQRITRFSSEEAPFFLSSNPLSIPGKKKIKKASQKKNPRKKKGLTHRLRHRPRDQWQPSLESLKTNLICGFEFCWVFSSEMPKQEGC